MTPASHWLTVAVHINPRLAETLPVRSGIQAEEQPPSGTCQSPAGERKGTMAAARVARKLLLRCGTQDFRHTLLAEAGPTAEPGVLGVGKNTPATRRPYHHHLRVLVCRVPGAQGNTQHLQTHHPEQLGVHFTKMLSQQSLGVSVTTFALMILFFLLFLGGGGNCILLGILAAYDSVNPSLLWLLGRSFLSVLPVRWPPHLSVFGCIRLSFKFLSALRFLWVGNCLSLS